MIGDLSSSLSTLLADSSAPASVRAADIAFDPPADGYNPDKTTINLFLYDIRENAELRSNEPVVERQNGIVTIRRPPVRLSCSYLVTTWMESGITGEEAILGQHKLLGDILEFLYRTPAIEASFLQGALAQSLYPVALAVAQADLVRNPAEFWSALGGKLRPSFTLTATIAMQRQDAPVTAPAVSSRSIRVRDVATGVTETVVAIGGTLTDSVSHSVIAGADVSIVELGLVAVSRTDGRFSFGAIPPGSYALRAAKAGYVTKDTAIQAPGASVSAFDIALSPAP